MVGETFKIRKFQSHLANLTPMVYVKVQVHSSSRNTCPIIWLLLFLELNTPLYYLLNHMLVQFLTQLVGILCCPPWIVSCRFTIKKLISSAKWVQATPYLAKFYGAKIKIRLTLFKLESLVNFQLKKMRPCLKKFNQSLSSKLWI